VRSSLWSNDGEDRADAEYGKCHERAKRRIRRRRYEALHPG
jgi:hypothetical protein